MPRQSEGGSRIDDAGRVWVWRGDGTAGVYSGDLTKYEDVPLGDCRPSAGSTAACTPRFCDTCYGTSEYSLPSLSGYASFVVGTCCMFSGDSSAPDTCIPGDLSRETIERYRQPLRTHNTMIHGAGGEFRYAHGPKIGKVLAYWHVHKGGRVYLNAVAGVSASNPVAEKCIETFSKSSGIPCGFSLGTADVGLNEVILECSLVVIPARQGCFAKIVTPSALTETLKTFCFTPHYNITPRLLADFGHAEDPGRTTAEEDFYQAHIESLNNYIKLLKLVYSHKGKTSLEKYLKEGEEVHTQLVGPAEEKILEAKMQVSAGGAGDGAQRGPRGEQRERGDPGERDQRVPRRHPSDGDYAPYYRHPPPPPQRYGDPRYGSRYPPAYGGYRDWPVDDFDPRAPEWERYQPPPPPPPPFYHQLHGSWMPPRYDQHQRPPPGQPQSQISREVLEDTLLETLGIEKKAPPKRENRFQETLKGMIAAALETHVRGEVRGGDDREERDRSRAHRDRSPVRGSGDEAAQRTPPRGRGGAQKLMEDAVSAPYGNNSKLDLMTEKVTQLTAIIQDMVAKQNPVAVPAPPQQDSSVQQQIPAATPAQAPPQLQTPEPPPPGVEVPEQPPTNLRPPPTTTHAATPVVPATLNAGLRVSGGSQRAEASVTDSRRRFNELYDL
uniref:Polyprotein n=1 Tax=Latid herpesvirus 1 TaxID=3096545 RepID=A0AB33V6L1_9VIRU